MNVAVLRRVLALGVVTGMRSMAGAAALAIEEARLPMLPPVAMAAGEMLLDKTTLIGHRIDPIPLAGRAVMGALVGAMVAREEKNGLMLGALLGSAAAIVATHVAYRVRARARVRLPNAVAGALEDALVIGLASRYGRRGRR